MSVKEDAMDSANQGEEAPFTGIFYQSKYCLDDKGFQRVVGNPNFVSIELPDPCLNFLKQKGDKTGVVELIDSCNGLLLCTCVVKPIGSKKSKAANTCFVCNPLTQEKVSMSQPTGQYRRLYYALLAVLDSAGCLQYKVLCLFSSYTFWKLLVLSSESETGEWEEVEGRFPPLSHEVGTSSKVFVNGSLFWDCLEGHILVYHLNVENEQSCYELIEAPAAPLGRCLWKYGDKLRCYCHGYSDEFLAWSLVVGEKDKKIKWELDGCEEFETVSDDISREMSEGWLYLKKSAVPRPQFKIICYRPESKTMFLIALGHIFSYQLSDRVIVGKFNQDGLRGAQLLNCALPYVHSLAHIQKSYTA